jgi:hypothetical protein
VDRTPAGVSFVWGLLLRSHTCTGAWWAARLSPAARSPKLNPTKQQLARLKGYQLRHEKIPRGFGPAPKSSIIRNETGRQLGRPVI